jgi:Kef-type K+ transport system membrane component KefB
MVGYGLMVLFTIVIFLLIRNYGEVLTAPAAKVNLVASAPPKSDIFFHVLLALAAIIVTGQVLAKLFSYLGQPPVIGEVVAGILLGPSLLGTEISALVLPPSIAPFLGIIAQLGVVLYMFLVGLELNPALLKHRAHATVTISHASILVPFLLGSLLALLLYPQLSSSDVSFTSFALFMGVAMSITAFPVLARILTDYRLTRTKLGILALSCAAIDDVTAWCLLAFVVGVAKAQMGEGFFVVAGALTYIAFMFLMARPLLEWITQRWAGEQQARTLVTLIFVALLLSTLTAEAIGIHAIFGAFLLGAMIPHDSVVAQSLTRQLESIVTILLLPAFFAFTGMRTRIDLVAGADQWLICGFIILTATLGKFGGTLLAARLTGLSWHSAAMLGTLMNTRGLMELIVLNVGLDLKVISPTLFAMMVLMAITTTALTAPVLRLLKARARSGEELDMLSELRPASQDELKELTRPTNYKC